MSKKPIIGGIILAAIIGVVFVGAQINPDNPENEKSPNSEVWSARIAGPEYDDTWNHRYSPITLERKVPYVFDFVAMGDSPKWIKIYVNGNGPAVQAFSEMLYLEGTLVDTGISEYYTWDYVGNKNFEISFKQCPNQNTCNYDIIVERHGNLKGSVTISLSR
uniref:Uncharacterized protein n=2 Tax=environmental samples TaxID=651140 RepID=A0A075HSC4_9ARCH|nr:hypothetical protein [uncultured marine thaumarchaeote KM3_82_D11]AIF19261.1 hypothetical protein [uncultured marine thaumarchaeote KM3_86_D01]